MTTMSFFDPLSDCLDTSKLRFARLDNNEIIISILDVIEAIVGSNSKMIWSRLKQKENVPDFFYHKFPGNRQKETPVANATSLVRIIFSLDGKKATEFQKNGAEVIIRHMNPTEELFEELRNRQNQLIDIPDNSVLVNGGNHVTKLSHRPYEECFFYIRVMYPENYISDEVCTNPTPLTLNAIKFGIAYNLNDRNNQYNKDQKDNGFMFLSFSFKSRHNASMIESLLREEFSLYTIYKSFEYLSSYQMAEFFKIDVGQRMTYSIYIQVAEKLLAYAVNLAVKIWPKVYESNCTRYNIHEKIKPSDSIILNAQTTQSEVKFEREHFNIDISDFKVTKNSKSHFESIIREKSDELRKKDDELLKKDDELLKKDNEIEKTKQQVEALQRELQDTRKDYDKLINPQLNNSNVPKNARKIVPSNANELSNATNARRAFSSYEVVMHDMLDGTEKIFKNVTSAAEAIGITPASLSKHYVGKKRHLKGKIFRHKNQPRWQPMPYFCFEADYFGPQSPEYIKALDVSTQTYKIFDSFIVAAMYYDLDRRALTQHVDQPNSYEGKLWSHVDSAEWGEMIPETSEIDDTIRATYECFEHKPADISIVAKHLETNETKEFDNSDEAAKFLGIPGHTFRKVLLDQPRQSNSYVFRSKDAEYKWVAPQNFHFEKSKFVNHFKFYTRTSNPDDSDVHIFETFNQACDYYECNKSTAQRNFGFGKDIKGKKWQKIEPDQCLTKVAIQRSN